MHPAANSESASAQLSRRDAIKRAAAFLGLALSPSILEGVLHAQASPAPAGQPAHLNATQFATAGAVAERLLPRTDTPGAADVGVPAFLDLMYGRYLPAEEQRVFAAGLADLDRRSVAERRQPFAQLAADAQDAVLRSVADASQGKEKTFFHLIRELTLIGYFTSETVGKNVLLYDPVPGRYEGCVPLADVGKASWYVGR